MSFVLRLFFILTSVLFAQIKVPALTGDVVDQAQVLEGEYPALLSLVQRVNQKNEVHLVLLTVASLQEKSIEEFSMAVVEKWRLGSKEADNGLLLLYAPKERKVRIEVGLGLEGVLTDAKCGRIIDHVMIPLFKSNKNTEALKEGLIALSQTLQGKAIQEQKYKKEKSTDGEMFFEIFAILFVFSFLTRKIKNPIPFFLGIALAFFLAIKWGDDGFGLFLYPFLAIVLPAMVSPDFGKSDSNSRGGDSSSSSGNSYGAASSDGGDFGGGGSSGSW